MPDKQLQKPVVFLIFNRPDTTARVFAEIARVRPATLLVIADGPRDGRLDDSIRCAETRKIVDNIDWPCTVLRNYADRNLGCKQRISSGLDWAFSHVEEAIILEDDCLPHPDFFRFSEEMLARYRNDEQVMMVAGTNYMKDKLPIRESYCFSRYYPIWGWASWRRAWCKYDIIMRDWERLKREGHLQSFYSQAYMRRIVTAWFDAAATNRIDTWDIQWFYSCLFNNGLCIVPKNNLISNIGVVGTHTSGNVSSNFFPLFPLEQPLEHPEKLFPNHLYDEYLFRTRLKRSMGEKIRGFWHFLRASLMTSGDRCNK